MELPAPHSRNGKQPHDLVPAGMDPHDGAHLGLAS